MHRKIVAGAAVLTCLLSPGTALANQRQIGGQSTDTSDYNATAVRTTMTAPAAPFAAGDNAARFFWIGTNLADGSFYQAGIASRWLNGCTGLAYFVEAFDAAMNTKVATQGACTYAGTHSFTLAQAGSNGAGGYYWKSYLDGSASALSGSTFSTNAVNIGSNVAEAISELSLGGAPIPLSSDVIPGVKYFPALQVQFASGTWYNTKTAKVRGGNRVCLPENVFNDNAGTTNEIRVGSEYSSSCTTDGAQLWSVGP